MLEGFCASSAFLSPSGSILQQDFDPLPSLLDLKAMQGKTAGGNHTQQQVGQPLAVLCPLAKALVGTQGKADLWWDGCFQQKLPQ